MLHQNLLISFFCTIFAVDLNKYSMATKSNTTFGFMLANHPNRFGFYPVMFRITRDRKTKRVKTGLEVKKADWNQKAKNYKHFRASCTDCEVKNQMLVDILKKYQQTYSELKEDGMATSDNIINKVKSGEVSESFLAYAKNRTQEIFNAGGVRNWKKYNGFCNKLESFLAANRKKDVLFADITPSFLSDFDAYLHTLPNERQPEKLLHPNTIQVVLNIFKTLINKAVSIDKKMKPEDNPFLAFKYKGVKTEKAKLNADELEALQDLELEEDSLIWHCRNYFFFSFYCAGIRAGDLIQLRWCNIKDGRLNYQMGKNHKIGDLELVPQALDILKYYYSDSVKPTDYIFPLLDNTKVWASYITQEDKDRMKPDMKKDMFNTISAKNALINKELAKMQKLAGIDTKISFHISRHSFAKAAKENGLDNLEVKALLGHTNISTTQKYIGDFDVSRTDKALESVFAPANKEDEAAKVLKQLQVLSPDVLAQVLKQLDK